MDRQVDSPVAEVQLDISPDGEDHEQVIDVNGEWSSRNEGEVNEEEINDEERHEERHENEGNEENEN